MSTALVGYGRPSGCSWTCVGAGAGFDSDPAALNSGIVSDATAVQWLSGVQSTASFIKLQCLWATPQPVRIIPLLDMFGLPAGTKIQVRGRRQSDSDFTYSLGGNSLTQRLFGFDDGSTGMVVIADAANDPLVGYEARIFNDVNGATALTAGQYIYPGEIDALQGWETVAGIKREFDQKFENGPAETRSTNNQPKMLPARKNRVEPITLSNVNFATAYGSSGGTVVSYNKLANLLSDGDVCCVIRQWQDSAGALDPYMLHQMFVYGVARDVEPPQKDGSNNRYVMSLKCAESPPR